jgi:hypothetical protein
VRALVALAAAAAAAAILAAGATTASAKRECRGFDVCVPVAGPWVLAPSHARVEIQLRCPRRFVVGGLDAQLSSRAIDLAFLGKLGSPVNPGITTSGAAVFVGRFLAAAGVASFRPHIGCIPAAGGGGRVPTALVKTFPPGAPAVRRVAQIGVRAGGTRRLVRGCHRGERLAGSTYAVGFYAAAPPARALASAVRVARRVRAGRVWLTVHGGRIRGAGAIVQLDLLCTR